MQQSCSHGPNNFIPNFPPFMSDGRFFTNFRRPTSNFQYRSQMIKNAETIMKNNRKEACGGCGFCPITDGTNPFIPHRSDLKELYLSRRALNDRLRTPILNQQQLLPFQRHQ